ncbi:hypothetical protein [Achromobacter spanius]|uniref:hypothetical protein n=1 Tax=Achromobacter spanius TaxID=217203 RepID=UPI00131A2DC5|nr:hypothetical protein [Achromobacter spanius]
MADKVVVVWRATFPANALFAMCFLQRVLQTPSAQMQKSRQRLRDTGFQPKDVGKHLLEFSTT